MQGSRDMMSQGGGGSGFDSQMLMSRLQQDDSQYDPYDTKEKPKVAYICGGKFLIFGL